MSIPKEPRQLMINIMYLVLTALLALNVSAEIFNAFEMVDGGLKSANSALDASNRAMPDAIREQAKAKASFQTYADRLDGLKQTSQEGTTYIDEIVNVLIDESGTPDGVVDDLDYVYVGEQNKKELKGKKNYDGTTRIMVDADKGTELLNKMKELKTKFLSFVDEGERATIGANLPINIDEEAWKDSPNAKKNWADFTFGHMPLGATMPIFSKFKNDIKASEAEILSYLSSKVGVGGATVVLDKYTVVSAPKKSYIIKGEKFETDVFLSASAGTDSQTGLSISVNGTSLRPDSDGVAKYSETASSTGIKKYSAAITITDPVTGERKPFKKEFEYEVGERSVAISASKMNVFYMGVDNPVEVSAAGVPSNQIKVSMDGGTITKNSDGTYTVKGTKPTPSAKINVTAPGMNASKEFRVKPFPTPVPRLGTKGGGVISSGELNANQGVLPVLENFDFDAKCNVKGFKMIRVAPRSDAEIVGNVGGRFQQDAVSLIKKAKPGDRFFFEDIKCVCPGSSVAKDIGTMSFSVR